MTDIVTFFAEQVGLLPLYAVIVAWLGFNASGPKHLLTVLGIGCSVYVTMFQAFDLKAKFGPLDPSGLLPLSPNMANMVVAVAFVCLVGVAAYGARQLLGRREA